MPRAITFPSDIFGEASRTPDRVHSSFLLLTAHFHSESSPKVLSYLLDVLASLKPVSTHGRLTRRARRRSELIQCGAARRWKPSLLPLLVFGVGIGLLRAFFAERNISGNSAHSNAGLDVVGEICPTANIDPLAHVMKQRQRQYMQLLLEAMVSRASPQIVPHATQASQSNRHASTVWRLRLCGATCSHDPSMW